MMFDSPFGATIPHGIGQEADPSRVIALQALDHSLVPFLNRPRFLRLVKKISHARDYAAGGFHVSVARGLAGGCADPAIGFAESGTIAATCAAPLGRDDLRLAWANAAKAYFDAFIATSTAPVEDVKTMLRNANSLADQAYALEGVDPPRDPQTGEVEPPTPNEGGLGSVAFAGIGFFMAGLLTYAAVKYGKMPKKGRRR